MVVVILLISLLAADVLAEKENLYQYDALTLQLKVDGSFTLTPESSSSRVREATATLLLYPEEDFRQNIINWRSSGIVDQDTVRFQWTDGTLGSKEFGYAAEVQTNSQRPEVRVKIPFPLEDNDIVGLEEYVQPTKTIDSDTPRIIEQAASLAEGEDDLFQVAFNVAHWVDEHVKYDLTTLTKETSQKASWVLDHREGVCDEMTSLFVAMMRSLGVPARFVSGISYTTSDLFSEPWQPHGWAEAYFPSIGWVPFDITFGEYGYIDVTHIKLRDGFDPTEPATQYEWIADRVNLEARDLALSVVVQDRGRAILEEIQLEEEIMSGQVGFGSYNLVKGILKNTADYYAASTLQLAVPEEIEVLGRNRRTILLRPKEVKETYWVIKVPEGLNPRFEYTFPARIYSEKNVSVEDVFRSREGEITYSRQDVEELTVKDEEKSYSRKISFECHYPRQLSLGSAQNANCTIKNRGNTNLKGINYCLGGVCEIIGLPINQRKTIMVKLEGKQVGKQKIVVSAENDLIEKKISLEYVVMDEPSLSITADAPPPVLFGDSAPIILNLYKESYAIPQNIAVTVDAVTVVSQWELEQLPADQRLTLDLDSRRLARKNSIMVSAAWMDSEGKNYSVTQEVTVEVKARSLSESITLAWNKIRIMLS